MEYVEPVNVSNYVVAQENVLFKVSNYLQIKTKHTSFLKLNTLHYFANTKNSLCKIYVYQKHV